MKFEEFSEKMVVIDNKIKSFIYFLIKNDEVVYIGKTENGFVRPFTHKDKDFDLVISIPFDNSLLDEKEKFLTWLSDLEYGLFGIPKPDKVFFLT